MLLPRKFTFSLFLLLGVSIHAQQNFFVSSYAVSYTHLTLLTIA